MTNAIPKGYHTITPSISIDGAEKAIELYKQALGATMEGEPLKTPDGKITHAEMKIGDSRIMIADTMPNCPVGATRSSFCVYLPDVDAAFKKATQGGLKSSMEPEDMFWGDRMGVLLDPWGNGWSLATRVKDMSKDEIEKAGKEWMQKMQNRKAA